MRVVRAEQRFRVDRGDGTTWHSFSAGAHYDQTNIHFGPLIALDEHVVDPGGGFTAHRHAGVELVSYVIEGTLRHTADNASATVGTGSVAHQGAGAGLVHAETNDSAHDSLRFVQMWLTGSPGGSPHLVRSAVEGLTVPAQEIRDGRWSALRARLSVLTLVADQRLELPAGQVHVFVVAGECLLAGVALGRSDSARIEITDARGLVMVQPSELLVWQFTRP